MALQPVINEFVFNHVGADTEEYVEIFADANVNLSEYTLLVVEGDAPSGTGTSAVGNVLTAVKLGTTDAGGRLVLTFNTDILQNGTQTLLLVKNYTGTSSNDLDVNNDGTLDVIRWTEIVDSVAVTDGGSSDKVYSSTVLTPGYDGLSGTVGGASRWKDGADTDTADDWVRNDFDLAGFPGRTGTPQIGEAYNTAGTENTLITPPTTARSIMEIQGSGLRSEYDGTRVITKGIVTAVTEKGFFIQHATGDGNDATSDAIFVFLDRTPTVQVGDEAQVTGLVKEYVPGGASSGNLSTTQVSANTRYDSVAVLSSGNALPTAVILGEDGRLPPTESLSEVLSFYESLEGMRVTVKELLTVAPTTDKGEIYGVIQTSDGPHATGLSERGTLNVTGGSGDVYTTNTIGGDFNPERIQIEDTIIPLPDLHTGSTITGVTGVMDYEFGNFQILATEYKTATQSTLERETTNLQSSATELTIATYNVENLDPGDGLARFRTIAAEIANRLKSPDIISLEEVQDNDGPGPKDASNVTSASETLSLLAQELKKLTGYTYAFIDNPFVGDDTNGGEEGGNIRVAFLYRVDRVSLVPGSVQPIVDPLDQQTNPDNPFFGARPPLAATFAFGGEEVTVIGNHFSSKSGSKPLFGEGAPLNGAEARRAAQADAVNDYVEGLLARNPAANVVVAGDINDFEFEEPLQILEGDLDLASYDVPGKDLNGAVATVVEGSNVILRNLWETLPENERYSYNFEGNSQAIDHMLVTHSLWDHATFDVVHMNSEFHDQTSDHDPLVLKLDLGRRTLDGGNGADVLTGGGGADTIAGGNGDDVLYGLNGADVLTGGNGADILHGGYGTDRLEGGNGDDVLNGGSGIDILIGGRGADAFTFGSLADAGDQIADFTTGDHITLARAGFGITGDIGFVADGAATGSGPTLVYATATGVLMFDADGAGAGAAVKLAELADGTKLTANDIWLI